MMQLHNCNYSTRIVLSLRPIILHVIYGIAAE